MTTSSPLANGTVTHLRSNLDRFLPLLDLEEEFRAIELNRTLDGDREELVKIGNELDELAKQGVVERRRDKETEYNSSGVWALTRAGRERLEALADERGPTMPCCGRAVNFVNDPVDDAPRFRCKHCSSRHARDVIEGVLP